MKPLTKILGYQFKNTTLLEMALTHRSIKVKNNERLEFLGDAVLNFVIAAALYQQFDYAAEGELSRVRASLVNEDSLAEIAQGFQLGDYLYLGPGELKSGGARRKSILADALEAIIGAIYLDADMLTCQKIILHWFAARLQSVNIDKNLKDAKSALQEYLQSQKLPLPQYKILLITGEAHAQHFQIACEVEGMDYQSEGVGTTRRGAEQMAAKAFYLWMQQNNKLPSKKGK